MNKDSLEGKLKLKNITKLDRKDSYSWLTRPFKFTDKIVFGKLFRVLYNSKNALFPVKLLIPIENNEDNTIVIDVLSMPEITRAILFDRMLMTRDFIIDDEVFKEISDNYIIKKSVKKLLFKNFKYLQLVSEIDLEKILYIPVINRD